jgi:hypothetical protein
MCVHFLAVFPLSRMAIHVETSDIQIHFMDRLMLAMGDNGQIPKFPPMALVVQVNLEASYEVCANDLIRGSVLPKHESVSFKVRPQVLLMRSQLQRHTFTTVPDDFLSGDNVILEPFTLKWTSCADMTTHTPSRNGGGNASVEVSVDRPRDRSVAIDSDLEVLFLFT